MEIKQFTQNGPNKKPLIGDIRWETPSAKTIVFCHGFKGFKDWGQFNLIANYFAQAGYTVIKFNFSHNGGTAEQVMDFPDLKTFGQNTYWKEHTDLTTIVTTITQNTWGNPAIKDYYAALPQPEIYLVGHSRGGGIALCVAQDQQLIKKIAAWAAVPDFISRLPEPDILFKWKNDGVLITMNQRTNQMMPMHYDFVESLYQHQNKLNITQAVKQRVKDVIWIHGTADESVDIASLSPLMNAIPQLKLIQINGAGHTFGGKHPYHEENLPKDTIFAIEHTVDFFNANNEG